MPRRNKRKEYAVGMKTGLINGADNAGHKPECAGCAFAAYGGACTVSDGGCLITPPRDTGLREVSSAGSNR